MAGLVGCKKNYQGSSKQHYDIGSRVDGFIAHLLAADIDVTLIDIRPLDLKLDGLTFVCDDATEMKHIPDESIESISALCSFWNILAWEDMVIRLIRMPVISVLILFRKK